MKKVMFMLIIAVFLCLVSGVCVMAENSVQLEHNTNAGEGNLAQAQQIKTAAVAALASQVRKKIQDGDRLTVGEKLFVVKAINAQRRQLNVNNVAIETELEIEQEQDENNNTNLRARLSNGRGALIKVMPETASERALQRLRLKVCNESNNCSIELKEVGKGNETKLAYQLKAKKQARFLGLFRTRMQVEAEINAETGEVIRERKPWWAFLASEPEESSE